MSETESNRWRDCAWKKKVADKRLFQSPFNETEHRLGWERLASKTIWLKCFTVKTLSSFAFAYASVSTVDID